MVKLNLCMSYILMVYILNEFNMFNLVGKMSFILLEEEVLYIYILFVVCDGKVIDKLDDINVKVFDYVCDEN